MKKTMKIFAVLAMLTFLMSACTAKQEEPAPAPEETATEQAAQTPEEPEQAAPEETTAAPAAGSIILATTTSTVDSGLLDVILPAFNEKTGIEIKIISVGTGKAIQMGKDGEADVLLVHDTASELAFMEAGDGVSRHQVMYNDFIVVGPAADPAKVGAESKDNVVASLKNIANSGSVFVSRADDSGTDKLEKRLWAEAEITPTGNDWYVEAGAGMGDVLKMASEKAGYTITDRATYLNLKDTLDLEILCENDKALFNQYGVIVVNPDKNDQINYEGAVAFSDWIISPETQEAISQYGIDKFGMPLFTPNAD